MLSAKDLKYQMVRRRMEKLTEIFVRSYRIKKIVSSNIVELELSNIVNVTNFIWSYLRQFFDDSHGLKASLKPLRRPFDRCQSRLEAINNGRDIKQINW